MNPVASTFLLNMTESDAFDFKDGQYKFYGAASDVEKAELLKDVIAFANAWKTGDAFIVIGVSEKNGRKDKLTNLETFLQDNDIQQFVNSKTNRRVKFLIYSDKVDGKGINVIQVARDQERPITLKKAFGGLIPDTAYIRSGSSTTIATPDQIAAMVKADQQISLAQANLDLEWADNAGHQRLGQETIIQPLKLVTLNSTVQDVNRYLLPRTNEPFVLYTGPAPEEVIKYTQACALLEPLRIWLKNLGLRNASGVKVRILIPKTDGIQVIDEHDLPRKPKGRLDWLDIPSVMSFSHDTNVRESPESWQIEIQTKTIQPQDEFWSSCFYVSSTTDQTIEAVAKIFADDLSEPIVVPLKIHAKVQTREFALEDIDLG